VIVCDLFSMTMFGLFHTWNFVVILLISCVCLCEKLCWGVRDLVYDNPLKDGILRVILMVRSNKKFL